MRRSLQFLSCLVLIAVPLLASPALAHGNKAKGDAWRAQHEDIEALRVEREQLESDTDRMKLQCMDAKGQDRSTCESESKNLKARKEALQQKMESGHYKREADREQRHDRNKKWKEHKKGHKDEWKKTHEKGTHPKHKGSHAAPAQNSGEGNQPE